MRKPLLLLVALLFPLVAQAQEGQDGPVLQWEEYEPVSTLVVPQHPLTQAKYPFVDIHGHQWRIGDASESEVAALVAEMDKLNMALMAYRLLLGIQLACAALAVLGKRGREALLVGSCSGLYLMLCDRLQYHNNRFSLLLFCFLAAFTACDRSFLLYRGRAHALDLARRIAPTLPRRLLAFQVSLLYMASGGGKALDPDWRSGQTMLLRFRQGLETTQAAGQGAPAWVAELLTTPWFAEVASKAAISLELALALGLWFGRTRVLALWAGAVFHLSIHLSARVELFSWVMGAAYLAFVTPEVRERTLLADPTKSLGRAASRLVPALDWLARFRVEELAPGERGASALTIVDRDGSREAGVGAAALLARALPGLFLLWPLFALVARGRPIGRSGLTDT